MTRNCHVRFGERGRETHLSQDGKARSAPTLFSPLLANIALHGMETAVRTAFTFKEKKPNFIRYADDFVVLHPTEEGVIKARAILETWLKDMGLELKPSKTRITQTLRKYQSTTGFDFLGYTIRQFLVGKTHSGRPGGMGKIALLGFKTIIKPSKEAVKQHLAETRQIIKRNNSAKQEKLIKDLNPVIRGWTYYYRAVAASETFTSCEYALFHQLKAWAIRRHSHKNKHWIMGKYWAVNKGEGWQFKTQETYLPRDAQRDCAPHKRQKRSVPEGIRGVGRPCAHPTYPCHKA